MCKNIFKHILSLHLDSFDDLQLVFRKYFEPLWVKQKEKQMLWSHFRLYMRRGLLNEIVESNLY